MNEELRQSVFALLESEIAPKVDKSTGRPGMTLLEHTGLWRIALDLNADYDRLHELVNQHKTLREMLGHHLYDEDKKYVHQTLVENVNLLTPELFGQNKPNHSFGRSCPPKKGRRSPAWAVRLLCC